MIRRAILKAVAIPGYQVPFGSREMPLPYGWGTGGIQVTAAIIGPRRRAEGDRPGRRRHHQRRQHPPLLRSAPPASRPPTAPRRPPSSRRATASRRRRSREGQILVYQVPIPEPLRASSRARRETRTHARARRVRPDARQALRGHRALRPIATHLRLPGDGERPLPDGALADPEVRQPEDAHAARRCSCSAPAARSASTRCRPRPTVESLDFDDHPFEVADAGPSRCALCGSRESFLDEVITDDGGGRMFVCSDTDYCRAAARTAPRMSDDAASAAAACRRRQALRRARRACDEVSLRALAGRGAGAWSANRARARPRCSTAWPGALRPDAGSVEYQTRHEGVSRRARAVGGRAPAARAHRLGLRAPESRDGLRMGVIAGANVGERLMAVGARHYGDIRGDGDRLAGAGRDRPGAARRLAAHLLRRHAAAPADRAQPGDAAAPGVHGRADRRARRLGAGAPARPAARAGAQPAAGGDRGHARSRRGAAARAPA